MVARTWQGNRSILDRLSVDMFIEMTGKTLNEMMHEDELGIVNLSDVGVTDHTVVRINQQGDIEIRKPGGWDIIGGLIGEFETRVKRASGLDWA